MEDKVLIGELLRGHGLKRTPIRTGILELFIDSEYALSASDVLARLGQNQDRVTVYRALSSFEDNGILHRASEDGQGIKYALCSHSCPDESHTEKHAHFVCDHCQHTYCLEDVEVPEVAISKSFEVHRINYTLSGVCKSCRR